MRRIRQLADKDGPNRAHHHAAHAQQQPARHKRAVVDGCRAHHDANDAQNRPKHQRHAPPVAVRDARDEHYPRHVADPVRRAERAEQAARGVVEVCGRKGLQ